MTTHLSHIHNIAHICAEMGLKNAIISPGSRSAPLTAAFSQHPNLTCRVVVDERSAAFVALGLAQQTQQTVALICTSGTAALNYGPALTEAFYQQIPLLVFTADRPPEWLDQQDNQTSHQAQVYGSHVRASFTLPVDTTHPDTVWHLHRQVCEAINRSRWPVPGPVHLNVPLREPLYQAETPAYGLSHPLIKQAETQATLNQATWRELINDWQAAQRKLIIVGSTPPDARLTAALSTLLEDTSVALITDITANIPASVNPIPQADMILSSRNPQTQASLSPDLLLSLGGPLVSKSLKLYLRKHKPKHHWRLDSTGQHIDTYQTLTHLLPVDPVYFLAKLAAMQN